MTQFYRGRKVVHSRGTVAARRTVRSARPWLVVARLKKTVDSAVFIFRGPRNHEGSYRTGPGLGHQAHDASAPDRCACRKSNPDIFVMQSAEDWSARIPCPLYAAR